MAELSDEEIALMPSVTEEDVALILESQLRMQAQVKAQEQLRESAIAKLSKLGLTAAEIQSLLP